MSGRLVASTAADGLFPTVLTVDSFRGIIEGIEAPVMVADRRGLLLAANGAAKALLGAAEPIRNQTVNIFENLFRGNGAVILEELATGRAWAERESPGSENRKIARFRLTSEAAWLVVQIKDKAIDGTAADSATQLTVQELLQEREITYRNLLAAYLKLQEVNRQKTVFLASAAHELKTPLAVIKGYYDLLLAGSLGRLTEKQKDILEESKESCEGLGGAGLDVLELFRTGERKISVAVARERFAGLPGRDGQTVGGGISEKRCEAR